MTLTMGRMFESVNGVLLVLDLFILGVFAGYTLRQLSAAEHSGQVKSLRDAVRYCMKELEGAVAFIVFFFGATIARAIVWLWRHLLNKGWRPEGSISEYQVYVLMAGVVICSIGALCILRVFSYRRNRLCTMLSAAVLAVFVTIFAFVH